MIYTERVAGCCNYPKILWPRENRGHCIIGSASDSPRRLAFLARTPVAQELPRINSHLVVVVKMKLDRVFAHAFRRNRFDCGLVHWQCPGGEFRRLSGLLVRLGPGLVAQRAGACIAQEGKRIVRPVAVLPLDVQTGPCAQIHFHRLWVRSGGHEFSIAQGPRPVSRTNGNAPQPAPHVARVPKVTGRE